MTKKTQEMQPVKTKSAFNLLTAYKRNDGAVEEGKWVTYVTEDGADTCLEFKIASLDSKAFQNYIVNFHEENAELHKLVLSGKATHDDNVAYINKQKDADLHGAAQHLLKGWRWTDDAGVMHEGELPWGDDVLAFNEENAVELLSLKRAYGTFLQYVQGIAVDYKNFLSSNLAGDIKN